MTSDTGGDSEESIEHHLRCNWFGCVQDLSDLDLQRSKWLDLTNTNPHWSYLEFCCKYPMAEELENALAEGWLTDAEFSALSELKQAINDHAAPGGDNYDLAAILEDPAWHQVVELAKKTRERLLTMVKDDAERRALSEPCSE